MQNKKTERLVVCAIMLALASVLSFIKVYEAPMGGAVTLCSMLPLFMAAVKYGPRWGLGTAFVYSLVQVAQALIEGNVFVYTTTFGTVMICLLFDYLLPFTAIGLAGLMPKTELGAYAGIVAGCVIRFGCHFVSGVAIWGQWAEGMSPYMYSLVYNATFMLPELILTVAVWGMLIAVPRIKDIVGIGAAKQ